MTAPHDGPCPRSGAPQNAILQGRYELIGPLGQGGMGTVYMARDMRLHNRPCVVKKLRDDFYREEDKKKALGFFEREADVLSCLQHPNIVHILDYFEENSDYFLVMEYVEGRDLHEVLLDRGLPFDEPTVKQWAGEICDVLEYLHGHEPPVIYRDLKPSNIMIDVKGRVKLVDFGIARPCEDNSDNTHVVSAGYSPPEQYWGAADPRSDIYALGATMFFLLTGQEPTALHACCPAQANPDISDRTDSIVQKATSQDPQLRYQNAREIRQALDWQADAKPEPAPRKYTASILTVTVILASCLALFAYQKFELLLQTGQDQLRAKEETLVKEKQEKDELNKKLNSYRRAVEAQEKANWEARQQTDIPSKSSQRSSIAVQISKEAQLTDPAGLKSADKPRLSFPIPLWGPAEESSK